MHIQILYISGERRARTRRKENRRKKRGTNARDLCVRRSHLYRFTRSSDCFFIQRSTTVSQYLGAQGSFPHIGRRNCTTFVTHTAATSPKAWTEPDRWFPVTNTIFETSIERPANRNDDFPLWQTRIYETSRKMLSDRVSRVTSCPRQTSPGSAQLRSDEVSLHVCLRRHTSPRETFEARGERPSEHFCGTREKKNENRYKKTRRR